MNTSLSYNSVRGAPTHIMLQTRRAEAQELRSRSHIYNHFLFNTLSTTVGMLHARPEKAGEHLCKLAELFRAMLGEEARVSLKSELEVARCYAEIERERCDGRFDVLWRIDCRDLRAITLPPMILNPLVENAIRYGEKDDATRSRILVSVKRLATQVKCKVVNSVPRRRALPGNGTALANVRRRLHAAFGDAARLVVRERAGTFAIHFTIPVIHTQTTNF